MSLILEFGEEGNPEELSGMYYINAVTQYDKSIKGSVAKHPLDSGVTISDHFISENMEFRISGIITAADITYAAYTTSFTSTGRNNLVATAPPEAIQVDTGATKLTKWIPNVIGQFLSPLEPTITGAEGEVMEFGDAFQDFIQDLMLSTVYNQDTKTYRNSVVPVALYEMKGNDLTNVHFDLVVTSFSVKEDDSTGNGCHFEMTLEKLRFVDVESALLPRLVAPSVAKQAGENQNKGSCNTPEEKVEETPEDSGKTKKLISKALEFIMGG